MPMSNAFGQRLTIVLADLMETIDTPFYLYDEQGVVESHRRLKAAFFDYPFKQYFAVKALPNPALLDILVDQGSGLDCSSPVELQLADRLGVSGTEIVFTPNNVSGSEYDAAIDRGALVTFDDRCALNQVRRLPEIVAFRVSAGSDEENILMGDRTHSKFGVPREELEAAFTQAIAQGARRFGLHSMTLANELDVLRMLAAAQELIDLAAFLSKRLDICFDYINFGGGPGIAYREQEQAFDFEAYASGLRAALARAFGTHRPQVLFECGRSITGPHGVLVTKVVSRARKQTTVIGVDACMSALMRPGMYPSAYHTISSTASDDRELVPVDIVGALCENNDKFGTGRLLPDPRLGDVLLIHDCGAHGHSMGFNYNGRLRPAEYLLDSGGDVRCIRRAESFEDYLSTVVSPANSHCFISAPKRAVS